MRLPLRALLFLLLQALFAPAHAQPGVLVSPLPDDLDGKQVLDVARQVLTRRGWTLVPKDNTSVEAEKDRSGLQMFVSGRTLRFSDLSQRPRGVRQREHREEGPRLAAVPQSEIDELRADLAAAFAGHLPLAGGKPLTVSSRVLFAGVPAGVVPESVMSITRSVFAGRRWNVSNGEDGALIAHIRDIDSDSTLRVFLADGTLRFTDRTTNHKGEKSAVPDRWLGYIRADLRQAMSQLAPARVERKPADRPSAAKDGDPGERLRKLKALLDSGAITQAEHDDKRAEILKGL